MLFGTSLMSNATVKTWPAGTLCTAANGTVTHWPKPAVKATVFTEPGTKVRPAPGAPVYSAAVTWGSGRLEGGRAPPKSGDVKNDTDWSCVPHGAAVNTL